MTASHPWSHTAATARRADGQPPAVHAGDDRAAATLLPCKVHLDYPVHVIPAAELAGGGSVKFRIPYLFFVSARGRE